MSVKMASGGVLLALLAATYRSGYASLGALRAALLEDHFDAHEKPAAIQQTGAEIL